jgi:hypothetical protein
MSNLDQRKIAMNKKYFFGWNNIKWFFSELNKIYSNQPSFFSKKRLESGVAFVIAQWGMIYFLLDKHSTMTMTDMLMWSGVEFAVAGYIIHQIQKEKKEDILNKETPQEAEQPEDTPAN